MGCTASRLPEEASPLFQERKLNDMIEKQILARKRNEKSSFKLLLLGAGESGKSTVLKQLRLLHHGGFTQPERVQYAQIVWVDLIQSMKILIIQARKKGIDLDCDQPGSPLNAYKQLILRMDPLHQIETSAAGGSNFLNDYVIKYSENFKQRRSLNLSGKLSTFDETIYNSASSPQDDWQVESLTDELQQVSNFQVAEFDRPKVARAISKLWKEDSGIQRVYDISNQFQLESNVSYYFDNATKFADPNYSLSDLDILKGRIRTTGITETDFNINSFNFKVLDAGGQRSERKKWIHCFENVSAILFVVALSEYDQFLFEDEKVNRMHEAIILFDSLCNSKWFINTPFILFLNKMDLFEEKLKRSPLHYHFPDYKGSPRLVDEATQYFTDLFLSLNRTKKSVYVHRTCATDVKSMQFVLAAVTDVIIQQNLTNSGMI